MIAQSQSGTGKTAAFVLSMLSRVDATKNFPQVLFRFISYMFLPPAQLVKKKNQLDSFGYLQSVNGKIRCKHYGIIFACRSFHSTD